jgi:hypothetical protein
MDPPPGEPVCPAVTPTKTPACLCGTCNGVGQCAYNGEAKEAGKGLKAEALCIKPKASHICVNNSILNVEVKPDNPANDCKKEKKDKFTATFNTDAKCPDGWYFERPAECAENSGVNNWIVQADCVKKDKVTIHTSCSCAVGMCYTYDNLYIINGYQLAEADTTYYYDA